MLNFFKKKTNHVEALPKRESLTKDFVRDLLIGKVKLLEDGEKDGLSEASSNAELLGKFDGVVVGDRVAFIHQASRLAKMVLKFESKGFDSVVDIVFACLQESTVTPPPARSVHYELTVGNLITNHNKIVHGLISGKSEGKDYRKREFCYLQFKDFAISGVLYYRGDKKDTADEVDLNDAFGIILNVHLGNGI